MSRLMHSSRRPCGLAFTIVVALLWAAGGLTEGEAANTTCVTVRPTFCTNVYWPVSLSIQQSTAKESVDLKVELMYVHLSGTRQCKSRFRELQCRYVYPQCSKGNPLLEVCKSECDDFVSMCPGADQSCDSFSTDASCYTFSSSALSMKMNWAMLFLGMVVSYCFIGIGSQ